MSVVTPRFSALRDDTMTDLREANVRKIKINVKNAVKQRRGTVCSVPKIKSPGRLSNVSSMLVLRIQW